ncbi:MAG: hypothetical protein HY201_03745 [Nitrospirae bacterium]|nr:hypothetical protein [Candidatus Troglogloeales bacterium]
MTGIATSCATSPTQPSGVAIEAEKIRQELAALTALYEERNNQFFSHLHPLLEGSAFFKESVQHDFETFSEIKMNIKITRLEIRKEDVWTSVYWEGTWKVISDASPLLQSGQALFIFSAESPPRLMETRGESPFGVFQKAGTPAADVPISTRE